ncbi:MAG: D-aminoacyl-tRNA deacylase [Halobacteriota archaeon]
MIGIVVSRADHASTHIGEHLLDRRSWSERADPSRPDAEGGGRYYRTDGFELREFDDLHIHLSDPSVAFSDPEALDLVVFVSRHSGDSGPLLTGHFTGNFGPAAYGGTDGGLARAAPNAQKRLVDRLTAHAPDGYEVGIECTHHGPSEMTVPSMFAEVGSGEAQWRDPAAARAVAAAVLDLEDVPADRIDDEGTPRQVVGFGGGHYAPRFDRIVTETDWAVGHIGADWPLSEMGDPQSNADVIDRAFEASNAELSVVEGSKPELRETIAALGYRIVSETWLRTVEDRSLDAVQRLEDALSPVDDGLRFGESRMADPDGVELLALPAELVVTAAGVDLEATYESVADHAIAFETAEGATKPAGRVAVDGEAAYESIVDALATVLEAKYDSVEREGTDVVARSVGFDPERAETLGIPEGPAFGALASGQAVEVDGETIRPETVASERVDRFDVSIE